MARPVILGIVGDSGSGKTTLAAGIARILGQENCTVICTDDYHRYDRRQRIQKGISAAHPAANYMDILTQQVRLLRNGEPVLKPVYSHIGGTLEKPEYVKPAQYMIFEGLLGCSTRTMRDCYDVKLFLDPAESLRLRWKEHRDVAQRGYSPEQVGKSLTRRHDDCQNYVHPQRKFADMVIRFTEPAETKTGMEDDNAHLDVRHILRPTLPHPDFSPLFEEGSGGGGIFLEMTRDKDGKPVDVLEILGSISDDRAEKIETLIWDLVHRAGDLKEQVGRIEDEDGRHFSHPLALTQLLVAYHMVQARLGVHAV